MSVVKINYYSPHNLQLNRQSDLIDKKLVHSSCPVFKHKTNRTFIGTSPIDFRMDFDLENHKIIGNTDYGNCVQVSSDLSSKELVLQLSFAQYFFWTDDPDVWFEFNDHPMTSLKNNFIAIGGWFNLSNWPRSTSLAIVVVDPSKPVILNQGDPLFRISFHSQNLDNGIILNQSNNLKKIDELVTERDASNWRKKLFSKTPIKKCPFNFVHKKP